VLVRHSRHSPYTPLSSPSIRRWAATLEQLIVRRGSQAACERHLRSERSSFPSRPLVYRE
jgi:hypothetical protein